MNNKTSITNCEEHPDNQIIALCVTCSKELCMDCLFDHQQFKDHKYEKLVKLKERYLSDLNKFVGYLEKKLETFGRSMKTSDTTKQKDSSEVRQKTIKTIEEFRTRLIADVDKFFQCLLEEVNSLFDNYLSEPSSSDISSSLKKKVEGYMQSIQSLKEDADVKTLKSLLKLNIEEEKSIIEIQTDSKQNKPAKAVTIPKLQINDDHLAKFRDSLRNLVYFTSDPTAATNVEIHTADFFKKTPNTSEKMLPTVIDNTNCLVLLNIEDQVIDKFPISAKSIPINARVIITPDGSFYILGGIKDGKVSNETFQINPNGFTLVPKASMKYPKIGNASCCYTQNSKDYILTVGGKGASDRLNVVERYSINENKWETMTSLNSVRSACSACVFNNQFVYCSGGLNVKNEIEKSIEKYDIKSNKWEVINIAMGLLYLPGIESASVQINDKQIAIFGGYRAIKTGVFYNTSNILLLDTDTGIVTSAKEELVNSLNFTGQVIVNENRVCGFAKIRKDSKVFGLSDVLIFSYGEQGSSVTHSLLDLNGFDFPE